MRLRPVDDAVLAEMVRAALGDAAPDEVTPMLTPGNTWTPERVEWLTRFHADRRAGLDGPAGEATWAVEVDGDVAGAVRLKRTAEPGVLETGIWLARGVRGRGAGRRAIAAVLAQAAVLGGREVRVETGRGNQGALAILRGLGFECSDAGGDRVAARRAVPGTTRAPGR
ncbi:GNAT family N-acetyltransferase [Blastococcus sp. CT_GayMR20]|nr:GNAT family N-acetyltransferase [Blastococcus sp. CT_GayMR20]